MTEPPNEERPNEMGENASTDSSPRGNLPFPIDAMTDLFVAVGFEIENRGCGEHLPEYAWGRFAFFEQECARRGLPFEPVRTWLLASGVRCSCAAYRREDELLGVQVWPPPERKDNAGP